MIKKLMLIATSALMLVALSPLAAFAGGEKDIEWCFSFEDGWSGCGTAIKNDTTIHGMTVHVSCSAVFDSDGYSSKSQPEAGTSDTPIASYSIKHYTIDKNTGKRVLKKECGETFSTTPPPSPPPSTPPANPPTDHCPNLDGNQAGLPDGYVMDDEGNCVIPSGEEPPTSSNPRLQVLGEEFVKPAVLPATGAPAMAMLLMAMASFATGGSMLRISKRRQAR